MSITGMTLDVGGLRFNVLVEGEGPDGVHGDAEEVRPGQY